MANNPRFKERAENDLIGNILTDGSFMRFFSIILIEGAQDLYALRMEMGKSISAPPPGLTASVIFSIYIDLSCSLLRHHRICLLVENAWI